MAANALLDRGWGKAAQFVELQGDVKHLVEVRLSVVTPTLPSEPALELKANDIKELEDKSTCPVITSAGDEPK